MKPLHEMIWHDLEMIIWLMTQDKYPNKDILNDALDLCWSYASQTHNGISNRLAENGIKYSVDTTRHI